MKKKYAEEIKAYNIAHKAKDHALWEIKNGLCQVNLVRNPGGRKPKWKYSKKTGQQCVKERVESTGSVTVRRS